MAWTTGWQKHSCSDTLKMVAKGWANKIPRIV
jgi:hypothetical protein